MQTESNSSTYTLICWKQASCWGDITKSNSTLKLRYLTCSILSQYLKTPLALKYLFSLASSYNGTLLILRRWLPRFHQLQYTYALAAAKDTILASQANIKSFHSALIVTGKWWKYKAEVVPLPMPSYPTSFTPLTACYATRPHHPLCPSSPLLGLDSTHSPSPAPTPKHQALPLRQPLCPPALKASRPHHHPSPPQHLTAPKTTFFALLPPQPRVRLPLDIFPALPLPTHTSPPTPDQPPFLDTPHALAWYTPEQAPPAPTSPLPSPNTPHALTPRQPPHTHPS